jgi:predicted acetyltransferase
LTDWVAKKEAGTSMKLAELGVEHESAFLAMVQDFAANDPHSFAQLFSRKIEWSPLEFRRYIKETEKQRLDWKPGPNRVSLTHYVLPDDSGAIAAYGLMRFPLDEQSESDGGNLFCTVPPGLRLQGNGSYCLSLMLFEAVRAGLRRALVTCPAENLIARRVIEKNRGEFLDIASSQDPRAAGVKISRYWINFR